MTEGGCAGSPLKGLPLYYDLLGLEPGASPDEVSRAYGELLRECDPEHLPEGSEQRPEAEIRLQSIKIAYRKIREKWPESVQAELAEAVKQDDDLRRPRASRQAFRRANRQFVRKLRIALVVFGVGVALAVLVDRGSPLFLVASGVVSFYTPWIALKKRNPTLTGGAKFALTVLLGVPMFAFLVLFGLVIVAS